MGLGLSSGCAQEVQQTMRVAIIGARWPDVEIESDILGLDEDEIARDPGATAEAVVAAAVNAEVILAGPGPRFDRAVIEQLNCRGIVRYGVGYDNVDVTAALGRGIAVAYVPDYGTDAVALHAASLALAALRRIPQLDRMVKNGVWNIGLVKPLHMPSALTAGVIGFGRIGRATAVHLRNLGFGRTVASDEYVTVDEPGIESATMAEVLSQADVISLHAPGSSDGSHLIGKPEIAMMRPGSILVNTARGSLVDVDALIMGLEAGRPAIAALDVFDPEPADPSKFGSVVNQVIMTPHMAWYTQESERALRVKTAEEGRRILDGGTPLNPVPRPEEA